MIIVDVLFEKKKWLSMELIRYSRIIQCVIFEVCFKLNNGIFEAKKDLDS